MTDEPSSKLARPYVLCDKISKRITHERPFLYNEAMLYVDYNNLSYNDCQNSCILQYNTVK